MDFDNTIVQYDRIFVRAAHERELVSDTALKTKQDVRDAIRLRPNGDLAWQRLQADVYGILISDAQPFTGVREFIEHARSLDARVFIVSHKTEFAAADTARNNLRDAARAWLDANGLIGNGGIAAADVFFEATREQKVERLHQLKADVAIDDLVEVFIDPSFPAACRRWLFVPGHPGGTIGELEYFGSWGDMTRAFDR